MQQVQSHGQSEQILGLRPNLSYKRPCLQQLNRSGFISGNKRHVFVINIVAPARCTSTVHQSDFAGVLMYIRVYLTKMSRLEQVPLWYELWLVSFLGS